MRGKVACPLFVAALALVAGCGRCGARTDVSDAGGASAGAVDAGAPQSPGALPATDLRSALVLVFPEFRGATVNAAKATMERTVAWSGAEPLPAALEPLLRAKGWTDIAPDGDAVTAQRKPFKFRGAPQGERVSLQIFLEFGNEEVGNLIYATTAVGTEHLGALLPALEGAREPKDTFTLDMRYIARASRAHFLVEQLVNGLSASGWKVEEREVADAGFVLADEMDGGVDAGPRRPRPSDVERLADGGRVPDPDEVPVPLEARYTLHDAHRGGRITVHRTRAAVELRYVQPLLPPRAR